MDPLVMKITTLVKKNKDPSLQKLDSMLKYHETLLNYIGTHITAKTQKRYHKIQ